MNKSSKDEARKLRKIVFGTSAGAIFEAYDFILFGSMVPIIPRYFFWVSKSIGILPVIGFAIMAATGNMYSGLGYPLAVTVIGILVLTFFLPETLGKDIKRLD